jgi:hypothetical protein
MTDEVDMAIDWICSQGWTEENLPSDELLQMEQAFHAGLEAGKPQWHDLRKDPNDLPKPNVTVLICLQFEKWTSSYIAYYRPASDKWQMYNICEGQRDPIMDDYIERDEVIAWCEIPKFEESE